MKIALKASIDFICKWWQIVLGFILGVSLMLSLQQCQSHHNQPATDQMLAEKIMNVVNAAVKTNSIVVDTLLEKERSIENAIQKAYNEQVIRDQQIRNDAENQTNEINKKIIKQIRQNAENSPDELAQKMADVFGGRYVKAD